MVAEVAAGVELVTDDARWLDELPTVACPVHGGMLGWRADSAGVVLTCRGRRHYWQAECDELRPDEVGPGVLLLHSVGIVYRLS